MFCSKCGSQLEENTNFCTKCGQKAQNSTPQKPQMQNQFIGQQPPPPYTNPPDPIQAQKPPKKRHTGCLIIFMMLLCIVGGLAYVLASAFFLPPKNLGVKYTKKDYVNAIDKIGVKINFNGKSGETMEAGKENYRNKNLYIDDYNWELSDYQEKQFELTPSEATALLNEIAPGFWWFDNLQVNIRSDGTMEGSSTADIAKLKVDLYKDIADKIPIPIPDKVNLYGVGKITITNNKLISMPEKLTLGSVPLPEQYMTDDSVEVISSYLERLYTVVPGLEIISLKANDEGNFEFDGIIPLSVSATEK